MVNSSPAGFIVVVTPASRQYHVRPLVTDDDLRNITAVMVTVETISLVSNMLTTYTV